MNVFVLDYDPAIAAQYHNDIHCRKMILESAQLLCSAIRLNTNVKPDSILYKLTHKNHPCTKLCSTSRQNFTWVFNLLQNLCKEFEFRFDKPHKTSTIIDEIEKYEQFIPNGNFGFALAMPDKYKSLDVVTSYRNYYKNEKQYMKNGKFMMLYTKREIPQWNQMF
jgi:hypothetical protein